MCQLSGRSYFFTLKVSVSVPGSAAAGAGHLSRLRRIPRLRQPGLPPARLTAWLGVALFQPRRRLPVPLPGLAAAAGTAACPGAHARPPPPEWWVGGHEQQLAALLAGVGAAGAAGDGQPARLTHFAAHSHL